MVLVRSSLLNEWRMQVPAEAPNVFLINIAPDDVARLSTDLSTIHISSEHLYPMVRGRLSAINQQRTTDLFDESVNAVYRDLNLSWSSTLPANNAILSGEWPSAARNAAAPVSVEQGLAKKLHLNLGDQLTFTISDKQLPAFVASIRSVDWDRMTPNFYFLFPPGVLDQPAQYNATWMTSLYRNETQEAALSHVLRQYPAITAYPVDDLLARIQTVVQRVSLAVEVILLLVLSAGLLVLLTCLRAGIDQKLHEGALLRTLGAKKSLILGSLVVEFAVVGLIAGLLAAAGAELTAWALQTFLFKMTFVAQPWLWVITPTISIVLIGCIGTAFCYRVISTPPVIVLRESGLQHLISFLSVFFCSQRSIPLSSFSLFLLFHWLYSELYHGYPDNRHNTDCSVQRIGGPCDRRTGYTLASTPQSATSRSAITRSRTKTANEKCTNC